MSATRILKTMYAHLSAKEKKALQDMLEEQKIRLEDALNAVNHDIQALTAKPKRKTKRKRAAKRRMPRR